MRSPLRKAMSLLSGSDNCHPNGIAWASGDTEDTQKPPPHDHPLSWPSSLVPVKARRPLAAFAEVSFTLRNATLRILGEGDWLRHWRRWQRISA